MITFRDLLKFMLTIKSCPRGQKKEHLASAAAARMPIGDNSANSFSVCLGSKVFRAGEALLGLGGYGIYESIDYISPSILRRQDALLA